MPRWPSSLRCVTQRLGIDVVAGGGNALNTQDDVRRDDAEHNDLSHEAYSKFSLKKYSPTAAR